MKKKSRSNQGFTLMELLVVMVILGLLATIGLVSFRGVQMKGRDTQRKNDLGQIQRALEMYYNDNGNYPAALPGGGGSWQDAKGTLYMKEVPKDPKDPVNIYLYQQENNGTGYALYATLENTRDICFNPGGACKDYGFTCGNTNCNYAVSSANITP